MTNECSFRRPTTDYLRLFVILHSELCYFEIKCENHFDRWRAQNIVSRAINGTRATGLPSLPYIIDKTNSVVMMPLARAHLTMCYPRVLSFSDWSSVQPNSQLARTTPPYKSIRHYGII
ncbi:hypothetical protein TNCV_3744661 [Trichonephila clavipes]|nr:hypothetical protein TNCV_3744661 [Trichonephila clavipes]